jgi:hypothetical protein
MQIIHSSKNHSFSILGRLLAFLSRGSVLRSLVVFSCLLLLGVRALDMPHEFEKKFKSCEVPGNLFHLRQH